MSTPRTQWRATSELEASRQLAHAPHADPRVLLLANIELLIAKARQSNLKQVAFLLDLAHLELKMQIHNVSEAELHALGMLARSEVSIEDLLP